MNQLFNYYHGVELPTLVLRTPSKDKLYSLPLAYSIRAVYNFNAQSTLDFNYPKYSYNEPTGIPIEDVAYNYIKGKMVVSVDDKYFLINSCPETDNGATPIKEVSCLSLDAEFMNRRITLSDTTEYQLVPLLQIILGLLPSWSLGTVDDSLIDLYRSFRLLTTSHCIVSLPGIWPQRTTPFLVLTPIPKQFLLFKIPYPIQIPIFPSDLRI